MVQVKIEKAKISQKQTALLAIGVFENDTDFAQSKELDPEALSQIRESLQSKEFQGKLGSSMLVYLIGKSMPKKLLLVGLGRRDKFTDETARVCSGKAALKVKELRLAEFSIVQFAELDEGLVEAMTEGICLALYSFNLYRSLDAEQHTVETANILINSDSPRFQAAADRAMAITETVNYARDLGNLPPNDCPPAHLASQAALLANDPAIKVKVFDRYELEDMKMGGIVSVGKGSVNPPKLVVLEYNGGTDQKPYLLVGKAVTFDTGGISIKPGEKMDEMKYDKCGGCTVIAIIKALSLLKAPTSVIGIVPAVENMPSGTSYRPGDILRMYNGKTVEVLNTDAEGRLILADAIAYGIATYSPRAVFDLATLTGAAIIALGSNVAALIGNNKQLIDRLKKFSEKTGEKMWELPLYDEFSDQIKSNFADVKNVGGRPGGAITAAAFLSKFVSDVPWIHMDIAGTAWTQEGTFERSYNPKGATGFGVRTLVRLLSEEEKPSG